MICTGFTIAYIHLAGGLSILGADWLIEASVV